MDLFDEMISYFAEKIGEKPFPADVERGEIELLLDEWIVHVKRRAQGVRLTMTLGFLLQPIPENRLHELLASNFLGVNTGGCTLMIDEHGGILHIRSELISGTPPQEGWEWIHRLISVGREWSHTLALWEDFVLLIPSRKENIA